MSFSKPVTPAVLSRLSPEQARELTVWSQEHSTIFDCRYHLPWSCPFGYLIRYTTMNKSSTKWALFLWDFYRAKHREEGRCDCDQHLAGN